MQFAVQDISFNMGKYHSASMDKMDDILLKMTEHNVLTQDLRSATTDLAQQFATTGNSPTESIASKPPSYHEQDPMENTNSLRIRASCYRRSCRPWCSCRCHIRREMRTPGLAKKVIGSLFIGYSGMPAVTEPCNERQCRKRSTSRIVVSYQFPDWFWTRSLLASFVSASVAGPELLLRLSNTVPYSSETYQHCMSGNVSGLTRLFEAGKASPFDLDPEGLSLLRVSISENSWL
jgi:hypothetical protein